MRSRTRQGEPDPTLSDWTAERGAFWSRREAILFLASLSAVALPVLVMAVLVFPQIAAQPHKPIRPSWLRPGVQAVLLAGLLTNIPLSVRVHRRLFPAGRMVTALAYGPTRAASPRIIGQALDAVGITQAVANRLAWALVGAYVLILMGAVVRAALIGIGQSA